MATFEFEDLKKEYGYFHRPVMVVKVGGKDLGDEKSGYPVSDVYIDLTAGYEASIAEFSIFDTYSTENASYDDSATLKKFTTIGAKVEISMGYGTVAKTIFVGAIMKVNYQHGLNDFPCIRITAMDVKGVMMSSNYSRQLTATCYSGAVREILERKAYSSMQSAGMITSIYVADTPDKTGSDGLAGTSSDTSLAGLSGVGSSSSEETSDKTIEMVAESDYEFIVKAAKRYNYEFYTEIGTVIFRKAKADTSSRLVITPDSGLYSFDVSYDVTGLVNTVVVRANDAAKAKVIEAKKTNSDYTLPSKAKSLIKGSQKVYVDGSVTSKEEAEYRANYLMENIAYRFGSLECELVGMPEYLPGYFYELSGLGDSVNNKFYITRTIHQITTDGQYLVKLEGKAAQKES